MAKNKLHSDYQMSQWNKMEKAWKKAAKNNKPKEGQLHSEYMTNMWSGMMSNLKKGKKK